MGRVAVPSRELQRTERMEELLNAHQLLKPEVRAIAGYIQDALSADGSSEEKNMRVALTRRALCLLGLLPHAQQLTQETENPIFLRTVNQYVEEQSKDAEKLEDIFVRPADSLLNEATLHYALSMRRSVRGGIILCSLLPGNSSVQFEDPKFRSTVLETRESLLRNLGLRVDIKKGEFSLKKIDPEIFETAERRHIAFETQVEVAITADQLRYINLRPQDNKYRLMAALHRGVAMTAVELIAACDDRITTMKDLELLMTQCNYVFLRELGLEVVRDKNLFKLVLLQEGKSFQTIFKQHKTEEQHFAETIMVQMARDEFDLHNFEPAFNVYPLIECLSDGRGHTESELIQRLDKKIGTKAALARYIDFVNAKHCRPKGLVIRGYGKFHKLEISDPEVRAKIAAEIEEKLIHINHSQKLIYCPEFIEWVNQLPDNLVKIFLKEMLLHKEVTDLAILQLHEKEKRIRSNRANDTVLKDIGIKSIPLGRRYVLVLVGEDRFNVGCKNIREDLIKKLGKVAANAHMAALIRTDSNVISHQVPRTTPLSISKKENDLEDSEVEEDENDLEETNTEEDDEIEEEDDESQSKRVDGDLTSVEILKRHLTKIILEVPHSFARLSNAEAVYSLQLICPGDPVEPKRAALVMSNPFKSFLKSVYRVQTALFEQANIRKNYQAGKVMPWVITVEELLEAIAPETDLDLAISKYNAARDKIWPLTEGKFANQVYLRRLRAEDFETVLVRLYEDADTVEGIDPVIRIFRALQKKSAHKRNKSEE